MENKMTGLDFKIREVAGRIRDLREVNGLSIEEMAQRTGLSAEEYAAHEAGHAVQYAKNYAPIKLRAAIIPVTRFGSMLAMPLFFIGLLAAFPPLLLAGIVLYSAVTLFQLVTLPVEFNASSRALQTLEHTGMLVGDELDGARRVLSAAAMTYVAALVSSLLTLLRLLILANRRR